MACIECRQQKVKCDAPANSGQPCSRCRRQRIECVYSRTYKRQRRPTKIELLRQLDALRKLQARDHHDDSRRGTVNVSGSDSLDPSTASAAWLPDLPSVSSLPLATSPDDPLERQPSSSSSTESCTSPNVLPEHVSPEEVSWQNPCSRTVSGTESPTTNRTLHGLVVRAIEIDECFAIFRDKCLPYIPIMEDVMSPNDCYSTSSFLFWTIVAIGSRKYSSNPTLIVQLGPRVSNMAKSATFRLEHILLTIQALVLQCAWPMPFRSLCNDFTPVLAGLALQLATTVGLHVEGNGQEFARSKVSNDRNQILARGRLWTCCLIVCQRMITANGTPPPLLPDTYMTECRTSCSPPSLAIQKAVSEVLTATIVELVRTHVVTAPSARLPGLLDPVLTSAITRLHELNYKAIEAIDVFHAQAAELHLLSFHLFKSRSDISDDSLLRMYELAIDLIELTLQLDSSAALAEFGPACFARLLDSAAIAILRIGKSDLAASLDLERGRKAYFGLILFHRKFSVRQDDAFARFSIILTNLWTSTRIFKSADGSIDSLHVRSRARLGMSMIHDCFWWWRQEYGRQRSVYEPQAENEPDEATELRTSPQEQSTLTGLEWSAFDTLFTDDWLDLSLDTPAL